MKDTRTFFVGSYSSKDEKGIHLFGIDLSSGGLTSIESTGGIENPSYLCIRADKKKLYAVTELAEGGMLNAFSVEDGRLTLVNRCDTVGSAPCHIEITPDGTLAFTSNYAGGSLSVFSLNPDGGIAKRVSIARHEGSGPNIPRQSAPHVHFSCFFDKTNELYASDLGIDKIFCYQVDRATGFLTEKKEKCLPVPPGCGPRHFLVNPRIKEILYITCELTSQVLTASLSPKPELLQTLSTLPGTYRAPNTCAAIKASGDGRIVFVSNRGHDSVASYMVDETTGKLTFADCLETGGKAPRDIEIFGDYIVCANQDSNALTVLKFDNTTGKLQKTGVPYKVNAPVCVTKYQ